MKGTLLIIDDDPVFSGMLGRYFAEEYNVAVFSDPEDVLPYVRGNRVDVVLTDLTMPKMDGLEILRVVKSESPGTDVIMMTAYAKVESAVEAMKRGAYDYIIKPFSMDEISLHLRNLFEKRQLIDENVNLKKFIDTTYRVENIIGESEAIKAVRRFVTRVAERGDATVLITGESGVGKELVARAIHFSGSGRDRRLVSVHCASMPEGFFEVDAGTSAGGRKSLYEELDGGSLLLDEVGDLASPLQAKLLGFLEGRSDGGAGPEGTQKKGMVIVTTNRDLHKLLKEGGFREDLFHRLNMYSISIPPLRARKEDIPLFAEHFLSLYKNEFERYSMRMTQPAMEMLRKYSWPGNVRELKNLFAKICLFEESDLITPDIIEKKLEFPILPEQVSSYMDSGLSMEEIEKNLIQETLTKAEGNMTKAAKLLDISYDTFRYRMKKFNIDHKSYKS